MTSIFGAGGLARCWGNGTAIFFWVWSALLMVEVQKRKSGFIWPRGNRFSSWYRSIFGVSNSLGRNGLIMAKSQS